MRLYLIQHGEAKSKEEDPDRPLTAQGAADAAKMAGALKPLRLCVRAVWHSGRARAAQTAQAFAAAVTADEGVVQRDGMGPKDRVGPIRKRIERSDGDLMLVGHLPFLARLAGRLLTGKGSIQPVAFQYGGVVCLERNDDGAWQVRWMLTPEALGGV
jgi:phosphohistidine phosphatase